MEPKHFQFRSLDTARIGDVAWQVAREGHEVKHYVEADANGQIADGFVPKTGGWRADLDRADVIVFDDVRVGTDVGTGELAHDLGAEGHVGVGGTPNTDRTEADFETAVRFVRDDPDPCVIEPPGEVQNARRLLYVGQDGGRYDTSTGVDAETAITAA